MSQTITIGERIEQIAEAHAQEPDSFMVHIGVDFEGPCGCVVCRAHEGEQEAWASVVSAMMLGSDFHLSKRVPRTDKPYRSILISDEQRREAGIIS